MLRLALVPEGVSFLWGLLLTPLSIMLAGRFGLIDLPGLRKIHTTPIPRGAGITLWTGFLFWCLVFGPQSQAVRLAVTGATMVFFAGYLDDMLSLSPFSRLFIQFAAAVVALSALPSVAVPDYLLYLIWIAGTTNAYNFIDGLNGLALGISSLSFFVLALLGAGLWSGPLAALALGLLPWNFPRAKTFVGDGGVYLLGFLFSVLVVFFIESMHLTFFSKAVLLALVGGVPVIDTLVAVVRRTLAGKSPFYPDRKHLHHRLLDRGLPSWLVVAVLCLFQGFFGLLARLWLIKLRS